ncbi:UDP-N-acetylmuramoyl-tripeptide--D-alanyl-D-alanine ligase [Aquincola tertiaricarbonis]|uniref:UDP-N-acetylmuramoyl-tripeptide--D-alanyl-D- alanine ligase n=1 Tax=Aquincola tertiaricarbonis TaxID=391953 RepID=UPI000614CCF7
MSTVLPMTTLGELAMLLPDTVLVGDAATPVHRVHSDTRTLQPGDLFVALRGERFDAHDFLPQAREAGAVAALAEHGLQAAGLPGLQVPDVQRALEFLAAAWRRKHELPLIAVTGSNGKTTVTQMTAAILRAWLADGALATEGNYNNHIGVPLTLLRLRQDAQRWHRAAVVELGMNHPGEIALLARIAAPTVALVNNAQREHQEFMATVEAVARENGSVIEALGPTGVAVFPADDTYAPLWLQLAGSRPHLTFARQGEADLTCEAMWMGAHWAITLHTPAGPASLTLAVAGEHNLRNALAAAACALAAGAPLSAIVQGLQGFAPVKGRSQLQTLSHRGQPLVLIDDSYNANPDSMRAAIDVLATLPAPRALLMGDMGEVGDRGPEFHAEVGAHAQACGIELLWAAGAASAEATAAHAAGRHFATVEALIAALPELPAGGSVVVKGSRFMRMERVVAALQNAGGTDAA